MAVELLESGSLIVTGFADTFRAGDGISGLDFAVGFRGVTFSVAGGDRRAARLLVIVSGVLGAVASSDAEADESGDESLFGGETPLRSLASGSSIWNIDVKPPEVRIGFGDLIERLASGLMTIGSSLFGDDCEGLHFCSNKLTSDVVGGMGLSSVGRSSSSTAILLCCSESLLGFGGAAGLRVATDLSDGFLA